MTDTFAADLLEAMAANHAEHNQPLLRALPGAAVSDGDVRIADSGLDDDTFNTVTLANFAPETARQRVAEVLELVRASGRPFSWWLAPTAAQRGIAELLEEARFPAAEREPAMSLPTERLEAPETPAELDIRPVRSAEELDGFVTVFARNWDPPSESVSRIYAAASSALLASDSPARYLIGTVAGEPVSTAKVFSHAGVAGIYDVCTLKAHRGRGYASAITAAAVRLAGELGESRAVLQASPEGLSVYRRLGFETVDWFSEHAVS